MIAAFTLPDLHFYAEAHTLRVGDLHAERPEYDNYPNFQREKVWSYARKRALIDTMFHKLPILPLFVIRDDHKFWVVDGQQRLATILEFLADGFTTLRVRDDPVSSLVEPNKRFSQLSSDAQDIITSYALQVWVINEHDEVTLGAFFRRLQQQQALTLAERLWTYRDEVRQNVRPLMEHPFWREVYIGKFTRRRTFLGSLYPLLMELDQLYTSITSPRLRDIATGAREGSLAPSLIKTVLDHLNDVHHLFAGTMIVPMNEVIPLYQAVLLLEKSEYDPKRSERGCLSPWYREAREASLQARRTPDKIDLLAKIAASKHQIAFWNQELPKMLASEGLRQINKKRVFSAADRLEAWKRQRGCVPFVANQSSQLTTGTMSSTIRKEARRHRKNCMIVHTECHIRLHEMTGVAPDIVPVEDDNS